MRITCPGCGKPFETDASSGEVACPHCGDKVRAEAFGPTRELPPPGAASETVEMPHDGSVDSGAGGALFPRSERYKPLGELGRGGMGVVYKAHDSKLNRVVALKVLIAGEGASGEEVERFFREASAAAQLRHPNIVPIHELDVREGRHFFTMDFVEGGPLSKLIAERKLTPRRAVEILRDVARAVHHAHEHGTIHRDIKPGNIIITPDGRPMVMDFGLAKQVEADRKLTRTGVAMGTPEYMAPEQARGETHHADARTDVWALGAVLYEMVTGLPPFVGATSFDIISKVVHDDPAPPRRHNHACPRDVETICLKCLEKAPARRYRTAAELAEDCRSFLVGEAISARPASLVYRTRKKLARHKGVTGVSALALALVVGLTVWYVGSLQKALESEKSAKTKEARQRRLAEQKRTEAEAARGKEAVQRKKAESEAAKAKAVTEFLREMLESADPELGKHTHDVKVLEVLSEAEKKLDGAFPGQPEVRATVHHVLGRTFMGLGSHKRAKEHSRAAVSIRTEALGAEHPDTLISVNNLGLAMFNLGELSEAEKLYRGLLEADRRVRGDEDISTLKTMHNLALVLNRQGRYKDAEKLDRELLEIRRRVLGPEHRDTLASMNNLAVRLSSLGEHAESERLQREVLEIQKRVLGVEHPATLRSMQNVAVGLRERGKLKEAEKTLRNLLAIRHRVMGAEHPDTLGVMNNLALVLVDQKRLDEAEKLSRSVAEARRRGLGAEHPETLRSMNNVGLVLEYQERFAAAEKVYRQILDAHTRLMGAEHPDTLRFARNLSDALRKQRKVVEAAEVRFDSRRRGLGEAHPKTLKAVNELARALRARGKSDRAEEVLRQYLDARRQAFEAVRRGPGSWYVIWGFSNRGRKGFAARYPPEEKVDIDAVCTLGNGRIACWSVVEAPETTLHLCELAKGRWIVYYAFAYLVSAADQEVTLATNSDDGIKVWLNGEVVVSQNVYRSMDSQPDTRTRVRLKKGANPVLVKITNGEEHAVLRLYVEDNGFEVYRTTAEADHDAHGPVDKAKPEGAGNEDRF